MDMDNANWAMDQLRAATEENEGVFPSPTASAMSHTDTCAHPRSQSIATSMPTASSSTFVSQFRIDGQPILPPLMTAEKRRQMQQLRLRALELEAKYKSRSATTVDETAAVAPDTDSSSSSSSSSSNSTNSYDTHISTMNTVPRCTPQLQQTKTFIYDSTMANSHSSRNRPLTLDIEPKLNHVIPTICVKPPTPLRGDQQPPKPPPYPIAPTTRTSPQLKLGTTQRKLNNITSRIMKFEQSPASRLAEEPQPINVLWQKKQISSVPDKRMLRSSTSPALNAAQLYGQPMQRSRSFTLEEPSQALVDHMKRSGAAGVSPSSPRCRFALPPSSIASGNGTCCSSAQSLTHLRRDTIESKAKQVQRSVSSSCVDLAISRRCGGHTHTRRSPQHPQQQQQQLKQLLQRALHEADDVLDEQDQLERKHLTLAKRQMFKDIKSAHRDRFQQLVQYQHEEQRRMQAEFDRQQKFLIEQICADINVSAYASPIPGDRSPAAVSEYTSTDDLPTPSHYSPTDTITLSPRDAGMHTARKRLFHVDTESDANSELLPLDIDIGSGQSSPKSATTNNSNNNNVKTKTKKPIGQQRSQSKGPTNTGRRVVVSPRTPTTGARRGTSASVAKSQPQQQQQQQQQQQTQSRTRRSSTPSRLTSPTSELELEALHRRRAEAATLLNAVTRGFLVRRLFRTEQVQRIVQTIRDTLIFVLNLHLETYGTCLEQEDAANIRLKARLLQQLCSASRTLHLIFFQTSIKERMEIIARDRKRIKTKLITGNLKQRQ